MNYAHISKRIFTVPDPAIPGAFIRVTEKKGRTYANPDNQFRMRGKSALRVAKAARVAQRIEVFDAECIRRNDVTSTLFSGDRKFRDKRQNDWRAAA